MPADRLYGILAACRREPAARRSVGGDSPLIEADGRYHHEFDRIHRFSTIFFGYRLWSQFFSYLGEGAPHGRRYIVHLHVFRVEVDDAQREGAYVGVFLNRSPQQAPLQPEGFPDSSAHQDAVYCVAPFLLRHGDHHLHRPEHVWHLAAE